MRTGWDKRMSDNKILSVIIPSYNSKPYLAKCLDSLIVPDRMDEIDIIVVNDGSTDGSESICQEYIDRYPDSVTLVNKENGGHGSAINVGAAVARGRYMKVLDADDWFLTDNIPEFLDKLSDAGSDVILTCHHTINITTGEIKNWRCFPDEFGREYTMEEIMADWKKFDRSLTFHGITYRTDFYREKGVKLAENVFYEDHEYATYPCCEAAAVMPLDLFIYEYRIGDVSQSVSAENQLKRIDHTKMVIVKMLKDRKGIEDPWALEYCDKKIHLLLLSFMVTSMLCDSDRKRGVARVNQLMGYIARKDRHVVDMSMKHYKILKLLNAAHVGLNGYNKMLNSGLYNKIRHNKSFD